MESPDMPQRPAHSPRRAPLRPAVGPRLRVLLWVVFLLAAVLGGNSVYLAAITALEAATERPYQNYFYQYMFLGHLVLGLVLVVPLIVFVAVHLRNTRQRPNRRAVRAGYGLLATTLAILVTGILLVRIGPLHLRDPGTRSLIYWLHVLAPLAAVWLYCLHRLAGRRIRWRLGAGYAAALAGICLLLIPLHRVDPRGPTADSAAASRARFGPSLAQTATGEYIPPHIMMNDKYCMECHQDVHADWAESAHRFSSFNNPVYAASVLETREVSLERDGDVARSRWCAGCHDPVPLFGGLFDDPHYDTILDPTAHAGITCTVCHSITHVNSTRGNADYTIEEALHYPFAFSDNRILAWINRQLIKAKPDFHKQTFLKPLHMTPEFCSTCHKVHLPEELNDYRWLRGQNHYDSFLLSGVSGHGARSFYYPPVAKQNCNDCHMPLKPSDDFGARYFAGATELSVHNHLFPAANTGIAHLRGAQDVVEAHQRFMEAVMRVDLFGIREGTTVDAPLVAPLRPEVPVLEPGESYLLEVVIRALAMGHHFTQGTADSNQVWLDVEVVSGETVIGRSGGRDDLGDVDPWSHFVNVFMLDREGNRIERRNPQDIFVPLYDHQIPPGAAQTVHYGLEVPEGWREPITVEVRLQYRKFDNRLMEFVTGACPREPYENDLPITTLAVDRVTLPVGVAGAVDNSPLEIAVWERWNDYGIGLLLKGRAQLRQAAEAFAEVEALGRYDGPLNLARVYYNEGRLDEAVDALHRAAAYNDPPAPWWTMAWLGGLVNRQQGHLAEAEQSFRSVVERRTPEMLERGFDFSLDYVVINLLGETLFDRAKQLRGAAWADEREALLRQAAEQFQRTLELDSENVTAHYNLALLYDQLGERERSATHHALHARYQPDENARDRAVAEARRRYPAANHAANEVTIYPLQRPGAPGLDGSAVLSETAETAP